MRHITRTTAVILASALVFLPTHASLAQSTANSAQTDARWYAWLGCWVPDTSNTASRTVSASTTCIVPVVGSRAVDALTIVGGTVSTRDRLDASGKPHAIDGQGCKGTETANWSASGRRVYLQGTYMCGGTQGSSTTIFAIAPNGQFVRIERVRSGGGSIVTVDYLHSARAPGVLSPDAARSIEQQQLAISTARAAAAAPITIDEIVEAVHNLDSDVVRSWIIASNQRFDLDGQQAASLARAGLPAPVVQAIMGGAQSMAPVYVDQTQGPDAAYWNAVPNSQSYPAQPPAQTQSQTMTMYGCPPDACYQNPYSSYNGYGPQGYPYGNPLNYGYGYSPYGYLPFVTPIVVRQGVNRGQVHSAVRPMQRGRPMLSSPPPIQARPRGPVGRRP